MAETGKYCYGEDEYVSLVINDRIVWRKQHRYTSEERIGKPLVVREGKVSKIIPFAEKLMKQVKRYHTLVAAETDEVYNILIKDHLT